MNNYWCNKSVLVTGGSGFLGSHLVRKLVEQGSSVEITDIKPPNDQLSTSILKGITFNQINLVSTDFQKYLRSIPLDYIFHLAGSASVQSSVENPFNDFESNLRGTLHLLETLRTMSNPPKLVYLSSAAVYGNPASMPIREDDVTVPISPYGISKLAAERYLYVYTNIHGLQAVSARPFSVFGPGQKKQVIYDIMKKISTNPDRLDLYGSGREARDFIYVTDLIDALLLLAEKSKLSGEVFNIASGRSTEISKIASNLCDIMNVKPKIAYKGTVRPGVPLRWQADISRLESIGFNSTVGMYEGLCRTVDWFNKSEGLKKS